MEQLYKGTVNDLVNYCIETAKSDLQAAGVLMKEKQYRGK